MHYSLERYSSTGGHYLFCEQRLAKRKSRSNSPPKLTELQLAHTFIFAFDAGYKQLLSIPAPDQERHPKFIRNKMFLLSSDSAKDKQLYIRD